MAGQSGERAMGGRSGGGGEGRRCDLCGNEVAAVRRVALDREYDRLQRAHQELYACEPCFERKEQQRLGLKRR